MSDIPSNGDIVEGVVTARPCDCCGHHEVGIVTAAGDYLPLRPGMQVRILRQAEAEDDEPVG
ncbi:hypothetical protein DSCA_58490 [Desulfosarcina alkanivorans]|jgi:hypothetical protein|uniref:Uncharacterized protein n=1 Tax=Desulfosarcina alkanivorans TaxID=571177 RepID=A0A5K7YV67_9BACT|nr:hypothetical protein [Desulfosarcina alkanivorans]BBO71919.1 hypothetical protein DSCA_58490 [Desulfosarcina alkanivorans]